MIALADRPAVLAAIDRARSVVLASYILPPSVARRLAAAAARGATVDLSLAERPIAETWRDRAELARLNRVAVAWVRRAGGTARLLPPADPLHLKAALVDNRIAYLDDRNWSDDGAQTILADDEPGDVAAVRAALQRQPGATPHLRTLKPDSLALEVGVLAEARGDAVAVETESFGAGPVSERLALRAAAGAPTRLLVCERELDEARRAFAATGKVPGEIRTLDRLRADGVDVRVTPEAEKFALGPAAAWVGSTNATRDTGSTSRQLDWGMRLTDPAIVAALHARFERAWSAAVPYAPPSLRADQNQRL